MSNLLSLAAQNCKLSHNETHNTRKKSGQDLQADHCKIEAQVLKQLGKNYLLLRDSYCRGNSLARNVNQFKWEFELTCLQRDLLVGTTGLIVSALSHRCCRLWSS